MRLSLAIILAAAGACAEKKAPTPTPTSVKAAPTAVKAAPTAVKSELETDSESEPAPDSESEPAPDSESEPAPDSESEPAPDSESKHSDSKPSPHSANAPDIVAWRAHEGSAASFEWVTARVFDRGKRRALGVDDAYKVLQALKRHSLLCETLVGGQEIDGEYEDGHAALRGRTQAFRNDPLSDRVGNWPSEGSALDKRRVEVFFRWDPLTVVAKGGPLSIWSAMIPLEGSNAGRLVVEHHGKLTIASKCAPCELVDSPIGRLLPKGQRAPCVPAIAARRKRPTSISPEHNQKSWVAYLAHSNDPKDPAFALAAQKAAALGYNTTLAGAGCETSDFPSSSMYMSALYFASKRDVHAFSKLIPTRWTGPVTTYCRD